MQPRLTALCALTSLLALAAGCLGSDGHPPVPPPPEAGPLDAGAMDSGPGRCEPGAMYSRSALPPDLRVDEMTMEDVTAICNWGRGLGAGDCGMLTKRVTPSCESDILFTGTVSCAVTTCEVEQCIMDQIITPRSGHCGAEACANWADCGQRAIDAMSGTP